MLDRQALIADLKKALTKVPASIASCSWNTAAAYKKWAIEAGKAVSQGTAKEYALQNLINRYKSF